MALATPNQLYRLNKLGRLVVQPHAVPMTHVDADREIKKAMGVEDDGVLDGVSGGTSEAS